MESLAIAHGLELDGHVCNALEALGNLAEDSGRYDLAERIFGQAITVCRAAGDHYNAANVLAHLGVVAYGQGKLAAATERLEGALAAVRGVGQAVPAFVAHLYLAHVAVAQGELDRAAAHCRDVLEIVEPWDRHGLARVVPGVALLAGARGQRGSAIRLFGAADGLREAIGLILELPERAVYERAVDSARAATSEEEFAALWAAGRDQDLAQIATEAWAVASASPATEPRMPSQPTPPPTPLSHQFGLSPREQQVLRLLAQRQTDKEIAAALYVSPRTVGGHVTAIFNKLGVANRRDAAALAARHRLA